MSHLSACVGEKCPGGYSQSQTRLSSQCEKQTKKEENFHNFVNMLVQLRGSLLF